jgi:hypothetical protein
MSSASQVPGRGGARVTAQRRFVSYFFTWVRRRVDMQVPAEMEDRALTVAAALAGRSPLAAETAR